MLCSRQGFLLDVWPYLTSCKKERRALCGSLARKLSAKPFQSLFLLSQEEAAPRRNRIPRLPARSSVWSSDTARRVALSHVRTRTHTGGSAPTFKKRATPVKRKASDEAILRFVPSSAVSPCDWSVSFFFRIHLICVLCCSLAMQKIFGKLFHCSPV